jgi:hypothetical protein
MLSTCTTYNLNLTLAMTGLLDAAREVKDRAGSAISIVPPRRSN